MRPRHKAAENTPPEGLSRVAGAASMRPRHKAAENHAYGYKEDCLVASFNEAAA